LLHAAAVHAAGGDFPWERASAFRDWMINRDPSADQPSDASHEQRYRDIGVEPVRGTARLDGPGVVRVALREGGERILRAQDVIIAVGTRASRLDIPGLDAIDAWDDRAATSARSLPRSLVILGAGPTGTELAQVYARYGVPVTLVSSDERILPRDHPRSADIVADALAEDGVDVRGGVKAVGVEPTAGSGGAHVVRFADGSIAEGHTVMLAVGRSIPYEGLGLESVGLDVSKGMPTPDEQLRLAPNLYVVGDPAGPEQHTHLAHYQGEMAVRIALGEDVRPDVRAIPRAIYTAPESASVGLLLEQALEAGHDAVEDSADLATTARGYTVEAKGHATVVVDRKRRELLGVFLAGPGASEAIHEGVLAVKLGIPLADLADTIHAFPTLARVLGNLIVKVHRELGAAG
jgi:dihydrolipoamide dehydrogenase